MTCNECLGSNGTIPASNKRQHDVTKAPVNNFLLLCSYFPIAFPYSSFWYLWPNIQLAVDYTCRKHLCSFLYVCEQAILYLRKQQNNGVWFSVQKILLYNGLPYIIFGVYLVLQYTMS